MIDRRDLEIRKRHLEHELRYWEQFKDRYDVGEMTSLYEDDPEGHEEDYNRVLQEIHDAKDTLNEFKEKHKSLL